MIVTRQFAEDNSAVDARLDELPEVIAELLEETPVHRSAAVPATGVHGNQADFKSTA
jgi:hypothetical protein